MIRPANQNQEKLARTNLLSVRPRSRNQVAVVKMDAAKMVAVVMSRLQSPRPKILDKILDKISEQCRRGSAKPLSRFVFKFQN